VERPPPLLDHVFRGQLLRGPLRRRLESLGADEEDPLGLPRPAGPLDPALPRPDAGAELEVAQTALLGELADDRLLRRLVRIDSATRGRPELLLRQDEADEEDAVGRVHDECAGAAPEREAGRATRELLEPAQPFAPRHRGVRRRRRRQHEKPRLTEPPLLEAEL